MMKRIAIFINLLLVAGLSHAQISREGKLNEILKAKRDLLSARISPKNIRLKRIDNIAESNRAQEISKECPNCKKDFYGTGIDREINIKQSGDVYDLNKGKLWRMSVESPGAFAMQFYFGDYKIPEGGELYFTNAEGTMTLGAFGSHNNSDEEKFATQTIKGDKIIISYFEPNEVSFSGKLKITKIIHAFKNIYKSGFGSSEDCHIDVNCSEGSNYQDVKKAVARVSLYDAVNNFAGYCSGSLINTTSNSKKPYLLTAYHCLEETDHPWQWIFEFDYEVLICNGSVEPSTNSVQGAQVLSKGKLSDYALLNLFSIPDSYNVLYLGWDSRDVLPTKTVAIHHPNGDVKKISIDLNPPVSVRTAYTDPMNPKWFEEVTGSPKTDLKVSWDTGITAGGSSGSPLINQDKRVVGQLHGGGSYCNSPTAADYFGKLATSMNNPDPGFLTLKELLDDNNTAATNWASHDPAQTNEEIFKVNSIELTSNRWEDIPKLFGRITYNGNVQDLHYSWAPAADFVDPHAGVGVLTFGGQKPILPLTKQYSLTVTTPGGLVRSQVITVTIYDCDNKDIYVDLCSLTTSEIGFEAGPNETYQWSPAENLSSSNISNPIFTPPAAGSFEYTLVTTSANCVRTENYHLTVTGFPELPTFNPTRIAEKSHSGTYFIFERTIKTSDGNLLLMSDATGNLKLTKLDQNLNVIWSKDFISSYSGLDLVEVSDGFAILSSENNSGGVFNALVLIKTDLNGTIVWEKKYHPPTSQESYAAKNIFALSNGDLIVVGNREYYSLSQDAFMFRFTSSGNLYYSRKVTIEVNGFPVDYLMTAAAMNENNEIYIMADKFLITMRVGDGSLKRVVSHTFGYGVNRIVSGHDGTILGSSAHLVGTQIDVRLLKFDESANIYWTKYFGGSGDESAATALVRTTDGGFLIGLTSPSPANGTKSQPAWNGTADYWIFKIDNNGNEVGDVRYGGIGAEQLHCITDIGLGNYVITGSSTSAVGGDRTVPISGTKDTWMLRISDTGSSSTNPTPQSLEICESSDPAFNNVGDPYRNEQVIIGSCASPVYFENGSKTYVRASQTLVILPDSHIKFGSQFQATIGSVNLSPCDLAFVPNGSLNSEILAETIDIAAIETNSEDLLPTSELTLRPNPSNGKFIMSVNLSKASDMNLVVFNAQGIVVFSKDYDDIKDIDDVLALDQLSNGMYTVRARINGRVLSQKIIISK